MTDLRALWVAAWLGCAAAAGQAQPVSAAATTEAAQGPATTSAKDGVPARSVDAEPPRRLKFKGRAANCLCADPITDEEIDAAAARLSKAATQTQTPRSKP